MTTRLTVTLGLGLAAFAFASNGVDSGLNVGERVTPFHPTHIAGPHIGTDACPP